MNRTRLAAIMGLALLIAPGHWWRSAPHTDTSDRLQFVRLPAATPADWPEGLALEQAWHLDATNSAFAGFSALVIDSQGLRGFTDFGQTARFPRPAGQIVAAPVAALPATAEIAYIPDVEGAVVDPASGTLWISYEHHNAIRRIDADGTSTFARPAALRGLGLNSGVEAMARLGDGRFVMLAEGGGAGFLFAGDPVGGAEPTAFRVNTPGEYLPTDMAVLPDGRVLVLLRELTWSFPPFASLLMIGDPAAIRAGEVWELEPLATIDQPDLRENYEGLAVEPAGDGALTLWLISDSNRSALQRTLLLKLRWNPHTKTAREGNLREP